MDFELDDEQLELQRVVRDIAERECPPALVRAVVDGDDDGSGALEDVRRARLAQPDRARRRRRHGPDRGRAGHHPRGAGPGRRPDAVPRHDEPVRAARAGLRRRRRSAASCSARCAPAAPARWRSPADDRAGPARRRRLGARRHGAATSSTATGPTRSPSSPPPTTASASSSCRPPTSTATRHADLRRVAPRRRRARSTACGVAADRAFVGPDVAAGVERAREEAVTGLAAVDGRRVAAGARARARAT